MLDSRTDAGTRIRPVLPATAVVAVTAAVSHAQLGRRINGVCETTPRARRGARGGPLWSPLAVPCRTRIARRDQPQLASLARPGASISCTAVLGAAVLRRLNPRRLRFYP